MARLVTSGFEGGDFITSTVLASGGNVPTVNGTAPRSGSFAAACASGAGNATSYVSAGLGSASKLYTRAYLRFTALPASTIKVALIRGTGNLVSARLTSAGKLQLWNETGTPAQIGSDSAATLTTNTYYRIELFYWENGANADQTELRLDGVTVASLGPSAISTIVPTAVDFGFIDAPGATKTVYVDDVGANDGSGTAQTSWLGDGKVVMLLPISDSARATLWVGGAGGTTNLWDAVNNTPPAGLVSASATNTSQIEHSGSAGGTTDAYDANMTSYSTAGIGASDTINLVQPVTVTGEDIATGAKLLSFNIQSNPASTNTGSFDVNGGISAAISTYPTNWFYKTDAPVVYAPTVTLATSPVMRIIRPETASRVASCCFMGIMVDYTPGGPTNHPLAGTTSGIGDATGALGVAIKLAGTNPGIGNQTGDLTNTKPLAGTTSGIGSQTGDLTVSSGGVTHALAGTTSGIGDQSGALTNAVSLNGTAPGIGDQTGDLAVSILLGGATAGTGNQTGDLTVTTPGAGITQRTPVETLDATAATSITVTKPTGLADGDYVVISLALNGGSLSAAPSGFSLVASVLTQSNPKLYVYDKYITNAAGEGAWTFTTTAVNKTAIAQAFIGVDATTQRDVAAQTGTGSTGSNVMTVPSVTTVTDGAVLFYAGAANSSTTTFTAPAGMTLILSTSATKKQTTDYELRATAGATGTRAAAAASSALAWSAMMFAIRPAAGGGPTNVSANDTGTLTGVDAASIEASRSIADTGSFTGADGATIFASLTMADTGTLTGVDVATINTTQTMADTGSLTGADGQSVQPIVTVAANDTGTLTGVSAATIDASLTKADTGTLTGTDAASVATTQTVADTGTLTGVSAVTLIDAALTAADTGTLSGTDGQSVQPVTTVSANDTGTLTGVDAASVNASLTMTDTGTLTGASAASVATTQTVNDTGTLSGASAAIVDAALTAADTGSMTGVDAANVASPVSANDTGSLTGIDAASVNASLTAADSGTMTGASAVTAINADVTRADTGSLTGADAASMATTQTVSDSGSMSGTDAQSVQPITNVNANDSGTLTGASAVSAINADVSKADTGTLSGSSAVTAINTTVIVADTGTLSGVSSAVVTVTVTITDVGSLTGTELYELLADLEAMDAGTLAGESFVAVFGFGTGERQFIGTVTHTLVPTNTVSRATLEPSAVHAASAGTAIHATTEDETVHDLLHEGARVSR